MKESLSKSLIHALCQLQLLLICCILCASPALLHGEVSTKSNTIVAIDYEYGYAKSAVDQEIVESHVQLKVGGEFSPFLADASIKALYSSEKFDYVAVRVDEVPGGCIVKFSLLPRKIVKFIDFAGNNAFKSKVLRKKIGTKTDATFSVSTLKADVDALVKFYNEKGYPYARVLFDEARTGNDSSGVSITFNVNEGDKLRIGNILFSGNDAVDSSILRKAMRTKTWTILSFLKKTGIYKPDDFSSDIDTLRTVFRNSGYLDVDIDEAKVAFTRRANVLDIAIPVAVGPKYYVGNISIVDNKLYEVEELEKSLTIKTGDAFSPAEIDASCERLRDFYGRSGYINTVVTASRKLDLDSDKIDVEFAVAESERCFVSEIEIRGNSKTRNKVILREMTIAPGDPFDSVRMKNSRTRLLNTGYFSYVDIVPVDTKIQERKNLRVEVKEANTGKIGGGGGISTGGEVVGHLEFNQRNFDLHSENKKFQGGGQKFRARVQAGKHSLFADLNFEEPWWCDRELAVGSNFYFHKSDYDKSTRGYSGANYNENRLGMELYMRKRLYELWEGKLSYSLEDVNIYGVSDGAPPSFFHEKGHNSVSKMILSIDRDSRNSFLYPTAGSRVGVDIEVAGGPFFGKTKYVKFNASAAKHWPVFDKAQQVVSLIGRAGTAIPYGGDSVPFFDRFYLGGQNFMKGFKTHDIGPKENGTGVGGNSYAYAAAEYCFKIADPLRFYLFVEAGLVNKTKWNFSAKRYNSDVGFGFKISLMGMPLRLDFGFPVHGEKWESADGKKQSNKHGMRFNYSFGMSF